MNRVICLLLCCIGAASFAWGSGSQCECGPDELAINPPGTYPVVDEKFTFDTITMYSSHLTSGRPHDNEFARFLEEKTNVHVNFLEVIEGSLFSEKLTLMLSSADIPDTIMTPWHITAQMAFDYGSDGLFLGLKELIDERMPALTSNMVEWPEYAEQLVMPDGEIYALPDLEAGCFHCTFPIKFWIYEPWLKALGLEYPTTTAEFYDMLVAFKTKDPNGNGIEDEIPLAGVGKHPISDPLTFIMNAFIYTRRDPYAGYLMSTEDELRFVANTDAWREGLKFVRRLYDEELINRELYTVNWDQVKAQVENPGMPIVGSFPHLWYGGFTQNGGDTGRFADFKPLSPLKGPQGKQFALYNPPGVNYHTVISVDAPRPDIIAQWADWFYEDPIRNPLLVQNFNQEGVDWRYLAEDEKKLGMIARDGSPAQIIKLGEGGAYGTSKADRGWPRIGRSWVPVSFVAMKPEDADDPTKQEWRLMVATRDLYIPHAGDYHLPPNMVFPADVQNELADLTASIIGTDGIVNQWAAEFVVGERDIHNDGDWSQYLEVLQGAGVQRYVQIWQDAYMKRRS